MMQRTLEPDGAPDNDSRQVGEIGNHWTIRQETASAHRRPPRATFFVPTRQFDPNEPELMDRPDVKKAWLREELEILQKINRFGAHRLMLRYINQLLDTSKVEGLSVLDLATGAADIPRAVVAWARKNGTKIKVTAIDGNEEVLRSAREWCRDWPEIQLERCNLLELPYGAESFDIVICSLALHHFTTEDAISVLRRMNEIARVGYALNDLQRSRLTIWTAELLARTIMRSPIVRHDGPQSFRAAFTVPELRSMAQQAGMRNFRVKRHQGIYRMVLSGKK
jgi:2-polyprenyl-3-methyl-5-hydroxy-6-metoxy-1,4-benzoquinol methylase